MAFTAKKNRTVLNHSLFGALFAVSGLLTGAGIGPEKAFAANETISVTVDHAKVMRVSRPAATVIIGNPGIADATVQDSKTLVITGKSFGVTNMIILDAEGEPIADALLTVQGERVNAVTIYRRTERVTYSCSPNCERSLALGDTEDAFGTVRDQIEQRNGVASGQGPQGGGQ